MKNSKYRLHQQTCNEYQHFCAMRILWMYVMHGGGTTHLDHRCEKVDVQALYDLLHYTML